MKPFLGIDITTNRKNERLNGNEFLILKPSEILSQTLAKTTEQKRCYYPKVQNAFTSAHY